MEFLTTFAVLYVFIGIVFVIEMMDKDLAKTVPLIATRNVSAWAVVAAIVTVVFAWPWALQRKTPTKEQ